MISLDVVVIYSIYENLLPNKDSKT